MISYNSDNICGTCANSSRSTGSTSENTGLKTENLEENKQQALRSCAAVLASGNLVANGSCNLYCSFLQFRSGV